MIDAAHYKFTLFCIIINIIINDRGRKKLVRVFTLFCLISNQKDTI